MAGTTAANTGSLRNGVALLHRIDVLLAVRDADGEWVEVSTHASGSSARYAAMRWWRHCRDTAWMAFEWKTHYGTVLGRFVGTRIVPAGERHACGMKAGAL